ncbi:MAG: hypothetical protein U0802_02355 [Candidatus Binatia bacterium]
MRRFYDIAPQRWDRAIDGIPVHRPAPPDRSAGFVLIAVGTPGAREWIASWLAEHGLRPWEHYLAVA